MQFYKLVPINIKGEEYIRNSGRCIRRMSSDGADAYNTVLAYQGVQYVHTDDRPYTKPGSIVPTTRSL
jgi:hypothetical protein